MDNALAAPPPLPPKGESRKTMPEVPKHILERRTAVRIPLEAEIGMYSDSNFFAGFSHDISEGGMFVATYDLQPLGTIVDLEFMLPGGYQVKTKGEVRWLKDPIDSDSFPGLGVRFMDLSPEDKEAITEFIANREPIFHDE